MQFWQLGGSREEAKTLLMIWVYLGDRLLLKRS